ncbi:endolytic transglycosylase MltG [Actinomycetospora endophytica]|uniref:Endolytic murein transglycosylase n=1 Tax=Actinomycetospora endophytica TaxID=2291215 RepID=A0ABS8PHR0_9PSEU|nr:endolytic transglycosylase MltG [Actinomycetospora endophytica]MCD2197805.1 endolytic transglycosylase MltG [Actinomycetospora endophytica]
MTGPHRPGGGKRLVSMSTVSVGSGERASGPDDDGGAGRGARPSDDGRPADDRRAAVPRRGRGMRRPAPEWERPAAPAKPAEPESAAAPTGPAPVARPDQATGPARAAAPAPATSRTQAAATAHPTGSTEPSVDPEDAVTDTIHHAGAITGVPTTPSRIPLPAPANRTPRSAMAARARPAELRPPGGAAARAAVSAAASGATMSAASGGPRPRTTDSEPTAPAPAQPVPPSEPDDDEGGDDGDALGGLVPLSSDEPDPVSEGTRRRRRLVWPIIAGFLVLALAGGAFFAHNLWGVFFPPDFAGPGTGHVVIQVGDGDSTRDIGETLVTDGVVASARGFGNAAEDDPRGRGIQPGFYDMQRGMPAAAAVSRMLDPGTRLGRMEVRGGTQLDDTAGVGSARVPGVLSLISAATCVVEDSGARRCASVDDLRRTMATTDPARLGVPDWALPDVRQAVPERRLEGLVAPGTYDVTPGSDATTALTSVVRASASRLEDGGIVSQAASNNVSPYQALIVGSLAEREGIEQDFGKIARVVYNRLPIPMRLQLDSTINYPLDRQTLLTTPFDRAAPGPYNTYLNFGLPPTPIGAVSPPALKAALTPDPGAWVYFVKCQPDGASCFAVTPAEHDANRRLAQQRGAY